MLGLMQDWPLLCHRIIDHAAINYGERQVSRAHSRDRCIRPITRPFARARCGWRNGSNATASNRRPGSHPRLEYARTSSWYGVFGIGAVLHTVNPRLFVDQLV